MEQEQIREYRRLQGEMIAKLRVHAFVDSLHARHVFQYLVLPSFTPPMAWDVFRRGLDDDFILVRSAWRSDLDWEKLSSPIERLRHPYPLIPSIEVHQLNATSHELAQLATQLAAVRLSIAAPPSVGGVDGVTYEVAVDQSTDSSAAMCRLSWWHKPPLAWEELTVWVDRARAVFESAWAGRGAAAPIPLRIREIDDAASRHEAKRLFYAKQYGRVAELLAEIGKRSALTPAEEKMLELAIDRAGGPGAGEPVRGET